MPFDVISYVLAKRRGLTWNEVKAKLEIEGALNKVYDVDLDGIIDSAKDADTVDGKHAVDFAPATHSHVRADITDLLPIRRNDLEYPTENVNFAYLAIIEKVYVPPETIGIGSWLVILTTDAFTDKAIYKQYIAQSPTQSHTWARSTNIPSKGVSESSCYDLYVDDTATNDHSLMKYVNGVSSTIGTYEVGVSPNTLNSNVLSVAGSTIKVFAQEGTTPIITVTDTDLTSGKFGGDIYDSSAVLMSGLHAMKLLPPQSPATPIKAIVEVETVGSGTEKDPFRPDIDIAFGAFCFRHDSPTNIVMITENKRRIDTIINKIKSKNLKVLKPPKDYRKAVEQYKQLRRDFPEWIAGKDDYAYQTLGSEVFEYFKVADAYYGRVIEMGDKKAYEGVPDWEMRKTLNMWKERLKKVNVLKEEAEKHLKKLEEVLKKGW